MNFIKKIIYRFIKHIEIYGESNIHFSKSSYLCNNSKYIATEGKIFLGKNTRVGSYSELCTSRQHTITLKDYSTLYTNCKLIGDITIERYCLLATNIYMSSGNHRAFDTPELLIKKQDSLFFNDPKKSILADKPIHIHEDVWIGNGVFISPGITIGRGAIVGSNSVVTKNVTPYSVVVGSPAKEIKKRLNFNPPQNIEASDIHSLPYFYKGFDHFNLDLKTQKGIKLIDDAEAYLAKNSSITIEGISELETELSVKVGAFKETRLVKGEFQLKLNIDTDIESFVIHICIPNKSYETNNIYIKKITSDESSSSNSHL